MKLQERRAKNNDARAHIAESIQSSIVGTLMAAAPAPATNIAASSTGRFLRVSVIEKRVQYCALQCCAVHTEFVGHMRVHGLYWAGPS